MPTKRHTDANNTNCQASEWILGRDGRDGRDGLPGVAGRDGEKGDQGMPGPPGPVTVAGGTVYTRWGRSVCPTNAIALYDGFVAGPLYSQSGGGADFLCLPRQPLYSYYIPGVQGDSPIQGAEYEFFGASPLAYNFDHNVPCAKCYVATRSVSYMQPGRNDCPKGWTKEYEGYLMTERKTHFRNSIICVDKAGESIYNSAPSTNGATLYMLEATCTHGLPCPPYHREKELTCAVCTK